MCHATQPGQVHVFGVFVCDGGAVGGVLRVLIKTAKTRFVKQNERSSAAAH